MKFKWIVPVLLLCLLLTACSGDSHSKDLLLHLSFDEGSGLTMKDSSGHLPDTDLNYEFAHAAYMDNQDPQWQKIYTSDMPREE